MTPRKKAAGKTLQKKTIAKITPKTITPGVTELTLEVNPKPVEAPPPPQIEEGNSKVPPKPMTSEEIKHGVNMQRGNNKVSVGKVKRGLTDNIPDDMNKPADPDKYPSHVGKKASNIDIIADMTKKIKDLEAKVDKPKVITPTKKEPIGVVFTGGKVITITDTELIKAGSPGIAHGRGYNLNNIRLARENESIIRAILDMVSSTDIQQEDKEKEIDRLKATLKTGGWIYKMGRLTDAGGHTRQVCMATEDEGEALRIAVLNSTWGDVDLEVSRKYEQVK